jgi:hypothetical protein
MVVNEESGGLQKSGCKMKIIILNADSVHRSHYTEFSTVKITSRSRGWEGGGQGEEAHSAVLVQYTEYP